MQLQYAYILKQLLALVIQRPDESAELELELGVKTPTGSNNIDLVVHGISLSGKTSIAVEMKCYRKLAASGGTRGAHDIFMKDVYDDLQVLEQYMDQGIASRGVALIMNDLERFVNPTVKSGKCWKYDISQGHTFKGGNFSVPIGGRAVNIELSRSYTFNWEKVGQFWFCELEGT